MGLFGTDWRKQVERLLPSFKRGTSTLDFLTSLLAGLFTNGATWETFDTDIRIKAKVNGQKIVLQAALNYLTGLTGIIVETQTNPTEQVFIYNQSEGVPDVYTYNFGESTRPLYVFNGSENFDLYDFIVKIPFEDATDEIIRRVTSFTKLYKLAGKTFNVTDDAMIAENIIASADILTGFATPVEVVPAPGVGKRIVLIAVADDLTFNSAAYATNVSYHYEINGVQVSPTITGVLAAVADVASNALGSDVVDTTSMENQPLVFKVETGNPTLGDSDISSKIIYKIVDI